jgi:hypothetical protein
MTTLVVGALLCLLAADPTHEQSPTRNNAANRAAAQPPSQEQEMAQVPGGKATPKREWKSGDLRGKRKAKQRKKQKQAPPAPQETQR